jgi:Flp pilus assembly protein TadB
MAGVIGGGLVALVPLLFAARRARTAALAKTEALASWAEMLRDTIAAHAGLNQAVAATSRVAPPPIRVAVQSLAARAERFALSPALRRFAADVDDPVADLIVAALVIADENQARNLADLLTEIARSARDQTAMRVRVETGRARTYASSQALVGITLALVVTLLLFSPAFLEPYDTFGGQLVLGVVGGLFVGALWTLVQLGRPVAVPRLLGGIEGRP